MVLLRPPDDAQCPRCSSKKLSCRSLQLPFARLLSWATRRIFRLRLNCKGCGTVFWHLHALPRTVVGYHGCSQHFARELVANRISLDAWRASKHSYDWLGAGIYFWEHAPGRAWQWAREHHPKDPAVVATEIRLGRCLDLADTVFTDLLRECYVGTVDYYRQSNWEMPKNEGHEQKLRKLDRLVIDRMIDASEAEGMIYQTVRCPFEEGGNVYPGAMLKEQSHIQIAVRDKACISARVFLVDPVEAPHD
jgi:hypothetical protein